jgi:pimeloyl-ACP methyl ester carboxylesterase
VRKLPALVAAGSLALTGLVVAVPTARAQPRPTASTAALPTRHIDFGRCQDASLRHAGARCGYLKVPLDYSHPNGATIRLAVSRIRHTVAASRYQGVMLLNPGGPGGSGLTLSELGPIISQDFRRRDVGGAYDWIGFDPRGVGSSKPSLSCDPDYFHGDRPEYVPTTQALYDTWQARSRSYAKACGRAGGRLLAHMRTTDSARDMDRIRAALGASRINYYGFSYGTYLGQVYETLFPARVRRMVLDSNVDPRKVWYQANLEQDIAFERNLGLFFDWLAAHDAAYHLGTTRADVMQHYDAVRSQVAASPIRGVVGADGWDDIFLYAGYVQFLWPELGGVFANWVSSGAGDAVVAEYRSFDTPGDDNSYAVYNAVSCVDDTWKDESFLADQNATYAKAPFLTWGNAWFNGPCYHWPAKGRQHTKVTGRGVGRVLLVDETNDAATPYSGSRYLRSLYKKSRLIAVVGGTNHAVTPSGNPCTDRRIFDYLATGKLPHRKAGGGADVSCPAPPLPTPDPPSSITAGGASQPTFAATSADAGRAWLARQLLAAEPR